MTAPAEDGSLPDARRPDECYGQTVSGTPCELPEGHYPATHHQIRMGSSWMAWTDESMAEFARIADEMAAKEQESE